MAADQDPPGVPAKARVSGPASYFPSIEKAYGRPISDWKAIIRANGHLRHMELVTLLKTEHGVGHGHANALVAYTLPEIAREQGA